MSSDSTNPTPEQVAAARECAVAWLARVEDNVIHLAKRADVDSLSKHLAGLIAERELRAKIEMLEWAHQMVKENPPPYWAGEFRDMLAQLRQEASHE